MSRDADFFAQTIFHLSSQAGAIASDNALLWVGRLHLSMLLGIALGTGSVKMLLLADGTIIAEASSAYVVQAPQSGWAETNPAKWWEAVAIVVRTSMQD